MLRYLTLLVVFAVTFTASAETIPLMIPYTGTVRVNGELFSGNGHFRFAIINGHIACQAATPGSDCVTYWSSDGATNSDAPKVITLPVTNGQFSVKLGDVSLMNQNSSVNMPAIPLSVFNNSTIYLRVWFNDSNAGLQRLAPDNQLVAVPYAYRAEIADRVTGVSVINPGQIAANAVESAQIKDGVITGDDIASSASLAVSGLNVDSGTLKVDAANDRVAIGVASPAAGKLDVYSTTDSIRAIDTRVKTTIETNTTQYDIGTLNNTHQNVQNGVTNSGYVMGTHTEGYLTGPGTASYAIGLRADAGVYDVNADGTATGTVTNAYGILSRVLNYGKNSTVTNGFGIRIEDVQATNGYGVYQDGVDDKNYFAGNVSVGDVLKVDTVNKVTQTSAYVKEFSGTMVSPDNYSETIPACNSQPPVIPVIPPPVIATLGTIKSSPYQSFIDIEIYGSHRGYDNTGYFQFGKWIVMAGDKVSSVKVTTGGTSSLVDLWDGSKAGNYNNIDNAAGFPIRLIVNPSCGAGFSYTYVVRYYSGADFTPDAKREWVP